MKEYTKSSEDIQMKMKYKDFDKGEIEIKLGIENAIKMIFIINSVLPVPELNCAGPQILLTGPKTYEGCDNEGTSASNDCIEAFSASEYWMTTDSNSSSSIISIIFKVEVKPTKLIFKTAPESEIPSQITIN